MSDIRVILSIITSDAMDLQSILRGDGWFVVRGGQVTRRKLLNAPDRTRAATKYKHFVQYQALRLSSD